MASTPQHRYLVAYDIEDDRTRSRVADILEGLGWRVQESVFECLLDGQALDRLTLRLSRELEKHDGGNVRMYRLCSRCHEASFGLGDVTPGSGGNPWIVV